MKILPNRAFSAILFSFNIPLGNKAKIKDCQIILVASGAQEMSEYRFERYDISRLNSFFAASMVLQMAMARIVSIFMNLGAYASLPLKKKIKALFLFKISPNHELPKKIGFR
jgi:hypothetical protein